MNNRRIGLALLISSIIIGIIVLTMSNYLPNEILLPILIINGIGFASGIVLLNYKLMSKISRKLLNSLKLQFYIWLAKQVFLD